MASTSELPDIISDNPEEKLSDVFDNAMKIYNEVENSKEPTNSPQVQHYIQKSMRLFETATRLVSYSAVFSSNESVEELSTESLQYLLLPALLGTLSLKLTNQSRRDIINVSEVYFRDFIQRCKDYGITDISVPQPLDAEKEPEAKIKATQTEAARLVSMVMNREEKLKRYKEQKALQNELKTLKTAMENPNIDENTKREYFIILIKSYINQSIDELNSIEAEKPLLDFMEHNMKAGGGFEEEKKPKRPAAPLKPFIITKDDIQKTVYGLGYPSLPVLTVEEFYEQRVKEGSFPGPQTKKGITSLQETTEADMEKVKDGEDEEKEMQVENDDPELIKRAREMDEYKDDHKRGWGNRHNRS